MPSPANAGLVRVRVLIRPRRGEVDEELHCVLGVRTVTARSVRFHMERQRYGRHMIRSESWIDMYGDVTSLSLVRFAPRLGLQLCPLFPSLMLICHITLFSPYDLQSWPPGQRASEPNCFLSFFEEGHTVHSEAFSSAGSSFVVVYTYSAWGR